MLKKAEPNTLIFDHFAIEKILKKKDDIKKSEHLSVDEGKLIGDTVTYGEKRSIK